MRWFKDSILFFLLLNVLWVCCAEQIGFTRIKDLRDSIGNNMTPLAKFTEKYGQPNKIEKRDAQKLLPNAELGSQIIIYTFNDIGESWFFEDKNNMRFFLFGWLIYADYLRHLTVPKTIKGLKEFFEIEDDFAITTGNEFDEFSISICTMEDGDFMFIFYKGDLIEISWTISY